MVPADSRRIPRAPRYSGYRYASRRFAYRTITYYGVTFQTLPLATFLATARSYYPGEAGTSPVWALPRSLATTGGIIFLFSLPAGTKMFQFPAFASANADDSPSDCRVVPFGNPRIKRSFAPPRGLSQLITSFIACESLGIRRTPFPTFARL